MQPICRVIAVSRGCVRWYGERTVSECQKKIPTAVPFFFIVILATVLWGSPAEEVLFRWACFK